LCQKIFKMIETINSESYIFEGNPIGSLPTELTFLFKIIDKSQYILKLEDDWDDAGSEKYHAQTWVNAMSFLMRYAKALHDDFNIVIKSPKIYHGPKGSIDIIWEPSNFPRVNTDELEREMRIAGMTQDEQSSIIKQNTPIYPYRLVINIPKESKKAMFYADNYKDQISEGVFHLDNFNVSLIPFAVQL
jgi:hypothetical protein